MMYRTFLLSVSPVYAVPAFASFFLYSSYSRG